MNKRYVEKRDGGYWIKGTRVPLDAIVHEYKSGASADSIQRSYSTLTLEEVHGGLAYYLANQKKIDKYLEEAEVEEERAAAARREEFRKSNPELYHRLKNAGVLSP